MSGCEDDHITVKDGMRFESTQGDLHSPYVLGAQTIIVVARTKGPLDGWSLVASDPNVIRLSNPEQSGSFILSAQCEAVGVGTTDLQLLDGDGHVRATRTIEVKAPDWITLVPADHRLVMGPDSPNLPVFNPNEVIHLVNANSVTFRVRYYAGATLLHGNKAVTLETSDSGLVGDSETTYQNNEGEWITLTPEALGTYDLKVGVPGGTMQPFSVTILSADAVDHLGLVAQDTKDLKTGERFYLLARAYDDEHFELFGAPFDWTIDDPDVEPPKDREDLLQLPYKDFWADYYHVTVTSGEASVDRYIHMKDGRVTTSATCSTAPASGFLPLLLALAGILLVWRRKQRA